MSQAEENMMEKANTNPMQALSGDGEKMEMILDIPVSITVEIGRTKMSIRNLLQLNQGGIVALDRLAGEALDVLVNGTLVAHGEVVVVDNKFGVRLTDIVSKAERIKRLR
jgi:flagellar motor switch protein FliN/FliY